MNTVEHLHEAKRLINAGRYEEARAALKPIRKNPTAADWLKKLDKRIPPRSNHLRSILLVIVIVACVIASVLVLRAGEQMQSQRAFVCSVIGECK